MLPRNLPGDFGRFFDRDLRLVDNLRAWSVDRKGTSLRRRVLALGEALRDGVLGVGAADAPEVIATGASAVMDILALHPVLKDPDRETVFVNVFSKEPDLDLNRWRIDALDVLARGATGIALSVSEDDRLINALLATAFSIDPASVALRDVMLGKPVRDPSEGMPPVLNHHLIDFQRLQQLVFWGTIRDYLTALSRSGSAYGSYADWAAKATAHARGITGLDPDYGCGGATVTIRGNGFGNWPPPYTTVQFPTRSGSCTEAKVVTRPAGIIHTARRSPPSTARVIQSVAWSDTEITVLAPDDVGIGCVGFLITDGPPPGDPMVLQANLIAAAGMLQSVLGDTFGPSGILYGQVIVNAIGQGVSLPSHPCPPCLPEAPDGTIPNRFIGGPPVIRAFTVNGQRSARIHPNNDITLAWEVEGADTVTVTPRTAPSSLWPAALPPLPGAALDPKKGTAGPFPMPWEGADDWNGEYVLSATNKCTTVTDSVQVEMRENPPLFGIADTHVHFLAHLAFGGYGPWGRPYASDPGLTGDTALADALPHCDGPKGHGPGGSLPSLEGVGGHLVGGYDEFDGWPRHTTLAHQQAYVDWIKRAVDGGLRLAVCLAVNNELVGTRMTELYNSYRSIDDKSAITLQLDAMQDMVKFVDDQAGGPGRGWVEIAKTPADARRIVAAGKLALVPGVEVDSLGGWPTPAALEADAEAQGKTPRDLIIEMVQDLYDHGVRHVFPIHASNNAFGGPALFIRNYDAVNCFLTGSSFDVETADAALGISYRIDEDDFEGGKVAEVLAYHGLAPAREVAGGVLTGLTLGGLLGGIPISGAAVGAAVAVPSVIAKYPCPPQPTNWARTPGGHINTQGLTQYGEILVEELMRRAMVVDIDHMGHKTTESVFQIFEIQGYPMVSGHTGFRELKYGWRSSLPNPNAQYSKTANANDFGTLNVKRLSSEVDKTPDQLERLRRLGGMVSPITCQRDVRDCGCGFPVVNDNAGSSKSFAQAYLYALVHMHRRRVGLGTDINGAAQLPGPRFGPQGAAAISDERDWEVRRRLGLALRVDQVFAQHSGVRYSTPLKDYRHHRFMDYAGSPPLAPFDADQRDFWEAIAIWRSGTAPEQAEQPPIDQRTIATQNFIINLAAGLRCLSRADIPIAIPFPITKPWPFYNVNSDEQLAAYLASHANTDWPKPNDPARTKMLVPKLMKVWEHWQAMERGSPGQGTDLWTQQHFGPAGTGLYDANGNLTRSSAGRRDFDINMDGMAHYGMLPDLLQDMRNVGVQLQDMAALYRSAEDYIRVWERCEAKRLP